MKRLLVLLLAVVVVAAAFAGGGQEEGAAEGVAAAEGPLGKYDPGLTVSTWRSISNRTFIEGQDTFDNIWTQAIEDELGITFEYVWSAPSNEFGAKVNTSLAAGDLPDFMNKLNLEQYYNLARVGRLAPLSESLDQYSVGWIEYNLNIGQGTTKDMLTINDEIYGFGQGPQIFNINAFYARKDWLDAVGKAVPETVDEIIDVLYAFSEQDPDGDGADDTYGLATNSGFLGASMSLEMFFSMYDSYPNIWVKDGGGITYGSIMPETKQALAVLQQLHADGVLSPEWPVFGAWTEAPDEISQEKVGASFGQQWWHNWGPMQQLIARYPGVAEWATVYPKNVSGDWALRPVSAQIRGIDAMNSDFSNPEAIVKIHNLFHKLREDPITNDGKYHTMEDPNDPGVFHSTFFYFNDFFSVLGVDTNPKNAIAVTEALQTGDTSALTGEQEGYYFGAKLYLDGKSDHPEYGAGYGDYYTFGPEGTNQTAWWMVENDLVLLDAYQSIPTPAQADYAGDLRSTRDEMFIQMIVGELDLDQGWEQWLDYWENNGGAEWTAEVNEWYAENR